MKFIHALRASLMLLLAAALGACTTATPLEGRVLEFGTDKPIPNAIVVARWEQGYIHSTACVHVETGMTDEQGRFRLPGYKDRMPQMDVYIRGYERFRPSMYIDNTRLYVKPFEGSRGERLRYLQRSTPSCHQAGSSRENLLPMLKVMYEEASSLAHTADEKKSANGILFSLEIIELGYEVAERKDIERSRSLRK